MLPTWIQALLSGPVAPVLAAFGAAAFTLLSIWWKNRVEKTRPRSEVRLSEIDLVLKSEREFKVMVIAELDKCKADNQTLRIENDSLHKTNIDLMRQLAVAQLDNDRSAADRKVKAKP